MSIVSNEDKDFESEDAGVINKGSSIKQDRSPSKQGSPRTVEQI